MGNAIGQVLPFAVGIAVSPIAIVAVVLMLVSQRARLNGPMFLAGWLFGLAAVGAIVLAIAGPADANDAGQPAAWVNWIHLVLGLLLLAAAVRQWRGRPIDGTDPPMPKWMATIDDFRPVKAAGLGAFSSGLNPKNTILAIGAATTIAQTGISGGSQAVAYAVFAVVASAGVLAPIVIYFALGQRATAVLSDIKTWMVQHNAAIMSVLLLVFGVKLIGDAITGFTA